MLTRKHLELLADTIGQIESHIERDAEIAVWLPHLNQHPQFDEQRFRNAVLSAVVEKAKG